MKLTTKEVDNYTVVHVCEDITYSNVREFFAQLDQLVENDVLDVVLDLGDVPYITSRGLGAIVHTYTVLSKRGGNLIIVTSCDDVLESFSMTKLDKILTIVPDRDQAADLLKRAAAEAAAKKEAEEASTEQN